jgi:hypothetical protein
MLKVTLLQRRRYENFDGLIDELTALESEHARRLRVQRFDLAVGAGTSHHEHGIRQVLQDVGPRILQQRWIDFFCQRCETYI